MDLRSMIAIAPQITAGDLYEYVQPETLNRAQLKKLTTILGNLEGQIRENITIAERAKLFHRVSQLKLKLQGTSRIEMVRNAILCLVCHPQTAALLKINSLLSRLAPPTSLDIEEEDAIVRSLCRPKYDEVVPFRSYLWAAKILSSQDDTSNQTRLGMAICYGQAQRVEALINMGRINLNGSIVNRSLLLYAYERHDINFAHYSHDINHLRICQLLTQHGAALRSDEGNRLYGAIGVALEKRQYDELNILLSVCKTAPGTFTTDHLIGFCEVQMIRDPKAAAQVCTIAAKHGLLKNSSELSVNKLLLKAIDKLPATRPLVLALIRSGMDVTSEDVLVKACWKEDIRLVRMLLKAGAGKNPESVNAGLWYALRRGNNALVALLLANGARTDDLKGLHIGSAKIKGQLLQELIRRGAPVNPQMNVRDQTPLEAACHAGNVETVQVLLENGADVTRPGLAVRAFTKPEHAADILALLLAKGVNANGLSEQGILPLFLASQKGNARAVKLLLEHQARLEDEIMTPLMTACEAGHVDVVNILIAAGARTDLPDSGGRTALHYAAKCRNPDVLRCLVKPNTNVNIVSNYKETPLMSASRLSGNIDAVRFLLEHGADRSLKSNAGQTAFDMAGDGALIPLLYTPDMDVNKLNGLGLRPLMRMIQSPEAVRFLLDHGADATLRTTLQESALEYAQKKGAPLSVLAMLAPVLGVNSPP